MEKKINLKKPIRIAFRSYIEFMRPFLNGATSKELDVLSELIYQNYLKSNIPDIKDRFLIILNSSNRRDIENQLRMSSASFRNCLFSLKEKQILNDNYEVRNSLLIYPTKDLKIELNIQIEDEE